MFKRIAPLCFFILAICACKVRPKKNAISPYSPEYYSQLGSNINRLFTMNTGTFVSKIAIDSSGNTLQTYSVNTDNDSVILVVRNIGDKHKTGYWSYHHLFLSSTPDMPIAYSLEYLEQGDSREHIRSYHIKPKEAVAWENIQNNDYTFEEFNLSELKKEVKKQAPKINWYRNALTEFNGRGQKVAIPAYLKIEGSYRVDIFQAKPRQQKFVSYGYRENPLDSFLLSKQQYFVKLSEDNAFFASKTRGK